MGKEQIIERAYASFSNFVRPEHFTNFSHCEECAEHDETMRSCSLHELGSKHVGNPGWSPIPFLTEQAFGYVFPRLLELSLTEGTNNHGKPFLLQHLLATTPAPEYRNFKAFSSDHVAVVLDSIYYIRDKMSALVQRECCDANLGEAIEMWQRIADNK